MGRGRPDREGIGLSPVNAAKPQTDLREYVGCLRVHTAYGEGTEKLPSIVKAANQAELDFIVVTDKNSLHYNTAGMEGFTEQTAVIVGEEIEGDCGHCLALGIKKDVSDLSSKPDKCLKSIRDQGGFGVLCHSHTPEGGKTPTAPKWHGGDVNQFDAVEVWSFLNNWRRGLSAWNRKRRIKNPLKAMTGPTEAVMSLWDELLQNQPTAALVSVDAFGFRRRPKSDLMAFSYRDLFGTLRMHLQIPPFTRRFFEDKKTILDALRRGQGFIANDMLASARGFRFEVTREDGSIVPMGQEAMFEPSMTLRVRLPQRAQVRLITNGNVWFSDSQESFNVELNGAGVIRLEADLDENPWIISNPVYLRPAEPEMIFS